MYFHTTMGLNQSVYLDLNIRMEQFQVGMKDKPSLLGKKANKINIQSFSERFHAAH